MLVDLKSIRARWSTELFVFAVRCDVRFNERKIKHFVCFIYSLSIYERKREAKWNEIRLREAEQECRFQNEMKQKVHDESKEQRIETKNQDEKRRKMKTNKIL